MIKPDIKPFYTYGRYKFINYVHLSLEQKLEVLIWRNQDIVREKMYDVNEISVDNHLQFIDRLENLKDRSYWYIELDGEYVGSYNVTNYNEQDKSSETGIFFKHTGLSSLDTNIQMTKHAYDFSFNVLGLELLSGYTKVDNVFMVNLTSYLGFNRKCVTDNGYVYIEISKAEYFRKNMNKSIDIRGFLNFCKK